MPAADACSGSAVKGPYSSSTWQTAPPPGANGRNSGPPAVSTSSASTNGPIAHAASLASAASAPPGFQQAAPRQHGNEGDADAAAAHEQPRASAAQLGGSVSQQVPMSQSMASAFGASGMRGSLPAEQPASMGQPTVLDMPPASHALLQAVQQQQQQQAAAAAAGQAYRTAVGSPTRVPTLANGVSIPMPPPSAFQMPNVSRATISSPQGYEALAAAASQAGHSGYDAAQAPTDGRPPMASSNAALAAALSQANPAALYNIPAAAYESFAAAISQTSGAFSPPLMPRRSSSNVGDEYQRMMESSGDPNGAGFFSNSPGGMGGSASYNSLLPGAGALAPFASQQQQHHQQQQAAAAMASSQQAAGLAALDAEQQQQQQQQHQQQQQQARNGVSGTSVAQLAATQHLAKLEATQKLAASQHLAASQQLAAAQTLVAAQQLAASTASQAYDTGHVLSPLSRATSHGSVCFVLP